MANKETYENAEDLAVKIKRFFTHYANNRHKTTILPPCFYYDPESCDDNRYDMRPWIYATDWSYQFDIIDERVREIKLKIDEHMMLRRKSCNSIDQEQGGENINVILPPSEKPSLGV